MLSEFYGNALSAKMMFGASAVHMGFNFIRQEMGGAQVIHRDSKHARNIKNFGLVIGQDVGNTLAFSSNKSHVLVKGDMIFRPHLVIEADFCKGMGAAGIIKDVDCWDEKIWREKGNILIDIHK